MPKISEERRSERREQILRDARRCFAEHGYEGATVARLEQATGLSRGAIFNYFQSKADLFVELAYRDNRRLVELWIEKGWEASLRELVEEDPDWIGVYLEISRRERTDPELRGRHSAHVEQELLPALTAKLEREQADGLLRDDVPAEQIAGFVSLVANGLAVAVGSGEPPRELDTTIEFVRAALRAPVPPA
jgi:TetR/AcrR family transcriptional regulator, transcriptional repressor of aconitase